MAFRSEARTRLILRGMIAGIVSACACTLYGLTSVDVRQQDVTVWFVENRFLFLGPLSLPEGALFGVALWWTIRAVGRVSAAGIIWLISCSVLAWHVAVYYTVLPVVQALDDVGWLPDLFKRIVFGMPAGAVGALCVVGAAAALLKALRSPLPILCVMFTGALTGSAAGLMGDPPLSVFPVFLAWQTGVLVAMTAFLPGRSSTGIQR